MTTTRKSVTFDAPTALRILRKAASFAAVPANDAELLRIGDHAVYRLDGGSVIGRVGRGPERLESVRREVAVGRWLASHAFPVPRLVGDELPILIDGHPVTFWEAVGDGNTYATCSEMGELLRSLHELPPPDIPLPELRPFDKVHTRLDGAAISTAACDFLRDMAARLEYEYADLAFVLQAGPIHGDYNIGNVLRGVDGRSKVIDLDAFAQGPREWDLMHTAMYYDSNGWHTAEEYADFSAAYGFDVLEWPGYKTLRGVRELLMVTWLAQNAGTSARAAKEVEHRVATIREGTSRRSWSPF